MEKNTTTIEFDVKVKTYDMNKGELIDAIAAGSKLTKADAGRVNVEESLILTIEQVDGSNCPNIILESHTKAIDATA